MIYSRAEGARTTLFLSTNSFVWICIGGEHSWRRGTGGVVSLDASADNRICHRCVCWGAWCNDQWWRWKWPQGRDETITAVIATAAVWGKNWRGQLVKVHCNNQAAVYVMTSQSCKNPKLMHLLRCLFSIEVELGFSLSVVHTAGVANNLSLIHRLSPCDHTLQR